jgi:hypothetical protein
MHEGSSVFSGMKAANSVDQGLEKRQVSAERYIFPKWDKVFFTVFPQYCTSRSE